MGSRREGGRFISRSVHDAGTPCHTHTLKGPSTTATQEKPTMALFENYNESSTVWFSAHTTAHKHCPTYGGRSPIKRHTRSSVRLLEEEPCSLFVHATSPSRMAFFLSSALYLSFLSSELSSILMVFALTKKWQCPPLYEEVMRVAVIHTWMFMCMC